MKNQNAIVVRIAVKPFIENVEHAARVRDEIIVPAVEQGASVSLDFEGVRFPTQSFVHALLNKVLRDPTSSSQLSFVNCSPATNGAISLVMAYSRSFFREKLDQPPICLSRATIEGRHARNTPR